MADEASTPRAASGHEHSDVDVRGIAWFVLGLAVALVLVLGAAVGLFSYWKARALARDPVRESVTFPAPTPGPKLQEAPARDMQSLRAAEDERLGSYGWVDRQRKLVRVPIEIALDHLEKNGLPEWPEVGSDAAAEGDAAPVGTEGGAGPETGELDIDQGGPGTSGNSSAGAIP